MEVGGGGKEAGGLRSFHRKITGTVRAKVSVLPPDVLRRGDSFKVGFEVAHDVSELRSRPPTFDPATSPLGLLLLHDLLALLSPPLVDGVARVVDLEGVLVVHVGVLDFSGLLVKLQNVSHPKSDGVGDAGGRDQRRVAEHLLNHCPPQPFSAERAVLSLSLLSVLIGFEIISKEKILTLQKRNCLYFQTFERRYKNLELPLRNQKSLKNSFFFFNAKPTSA